MEPDVVYFPILILFPAVKILSKYARYFRECGMLDRDIEN